MLVFTNLSKSTMTKTTDIAHISERQMEIIEAAGKILSESGVSGLTIKNLAAEMGFTEPALYRHFKSKEDIIIAMLEYLAADIDKRLIPITSSNHTPEYKFKQLFTEQFRFFSAHPHFAVAVFSDGLLEESNRINQSILKIMATKMKHLMPIIMEGQQRGTFTNEITTEELIHVVMASFRLQMFKWRLAHFKYDITRHGENTIQSVLTLIKSKK